MSNSQLINKVEMNVIHFRTVRIALKASEVSGLEVAGLSIGFVIAMFWYKLSVLRVLIFKSCLIVNCGLLRSLCWLRPRGTTRGWSTTGWEVSPSLPTVSSTSATASNREGPGPSALSTRLNQVRLMPVHSTEIVFQGRIRFCIDLISYSGTSGSCHLQWSKLPKKLRLTDIVIENGFRDSN